MTRRKKLLSVGLLLGLWYVSTPYIALWQLYSAICVEDSAAMQAMIDWDRVRSGIKQDVMEGLIGMPEPQMVTLNRLPPFGAGFAGGIAGAMIEREITPQGVGQIVRAMREHAAQEPSAGSGGLDTAFFSSPTVFVFSVHAPGQDPADAPLRLRMEFHNMHWVVTRAWVPQDLVENVHIRT